MRIQPGKSGEGKGRNRLNRRQFPAGAGGGALSSSPMKGGPALGSATSSKSSLGRIGCCGRGTWIADLFREHSGYEVTAAHDFFHDRMNAFGDKFNLPPARRFSGLNGYQRLLNSKVDAVAIERPPFFQHIQAAAAVDAGVHAYAAKSVAVDAPGRGSIGTSAKKDAGKQLAFLIDFQTRTDPFYQEAIRRVQHEDAIGHIISGEVSYVAGSPWNRVLPQLEVSPHGAERRLRAWGVSLALSGNIITEQNIHSLDVMTWVMNQHSVKALGNRRP